MSISVIFKCKRNVLKYTFSNWHSMLESQFHCSILYTSITSTIFVRMHSAGNCISLNYLRGLKMEYRCQDFITVPVMCLGTCRGQHQFDARNKMKSRCRKVLNPNFISYFSSTQITQIRFVQRGDPEGLHSTVVCFVKSHYISASVK